MAKIFFERMERQIARAKARKLRALNALPTAEEGSKVGRKKGKIHPPKYNLKRMTEEDI